MAKTIANEEINTEIKAALKPALKTEIKAELKTAGSITSKTVFPVLLGISFAHLLNDTIQSLIPSTYPLLKNSLHLSFGQLGMITFCFQLTASLLQPFVGLYTDTKPQPYSLAGGMGFTLLGLVFLSMAGSFNGVLLSVALLGVGSSIFHPEASRMAYMASGGRRGMAQSVFQLGGNAGSSLGPLLAALIIAPYGQSKIIWFSLVALLAIGVLINLGGWYKKNSPFIYNFKMAKNYVNRTALQKGRFESFNKEPIRQLFKRVSGKK